MHITIRACVNCAAFALIGLAAPALAGFTDRAAAPATYAGYQRTAYYAPVRDGTKLAITVYRPTKGPATTRFPVLLWYVPGHRESIDPATDAIRSAMAEPDLKFFTGHGYAVAIAEMRGSGASFGSRELDRGPQIGRDGKDLIDWIAAQSWSDHRVGMIGASYQGFSQYATAAERPKALKAIFPEIAGFDDYSSMFRSGGILDTALSDYASNSIVLDDQNRFLPKDKRPHLPSAPVIDEDGDGQLADEIPFDKNGNGDFLDDGPPTYADGKARQNLYYDATKAHVANNNLTVAQLAQAPYRDSPVGGTPHRFVDIDPSDRPVRIAASGIAVYSRGGWFDYHARDTVMWFATLAGHTPARLMMAPTGHGGLPSRDGEAIYRAGPYFALFGDDTTSNRMMLVEKLRFFDHYVRGVDNGFDREPPVLLYVMGKGWREEREWPLARQRLTRLAFDVNGGLNPPASQRGNDRYTLDLAASSMSDGANRWNYGVSTATKPLTATEADKHRLTYTGGALDKDTEVTGHPIAEVTLSSTADDGDLFVYLEDVAPDGTVLTVSEGMLRANYGALHPSNDIILNRPSGFEVKPKLPWSGYAKADYRPAPFAGGNAVKLTLDLMPTSWLFKAGHRIRVSLAGSDAPTFALHPALVGKPLPTLTIMRGAGLSGITLPVIP